MKIKLITSIYLHLILFLLCGIAVYGQEQESKQSVGNFTPLEKGFAFIGLTGGASKRTSANEDILITKIIDRQKDGFYVQANGGYFLSKTFAVGANMKYDWGNLDQQLEDTDGVITTVKEAKSSLGGGFFIKNYIPITPNGRFNLFNVVGLGISVENKVSEQTTNAILSRYFTKTNTYNLAINPGIQVFIIKGFATEVGVNLAGLTHTEKRTTLNQEERTKIINSELDLKLNILSLNISFFYFFKT